MRTRGITRGIARGTPRGRRGLLPPARSGAGALLATVVTLGAPAPGAAGEPDGGVDDLIVGEPAGEPAGDPAAPAHQDRDDTNAAQKEKEEEIYDFTHLDLEELMEIEVTSVAGRAQTLFGTPAAVYVLTGDDVRRAGFRSIPEALRMVPGVTVGQISPSIWAISVRGLVDRFANRLLVLVDGRSVYDTLFSGVFWNTQDVLLEDLDRIEVIRGPGATLWGANAVNGVINIATKGARDTQGVYATGGGGNQEQGFGAVRYGAALGENAWFRVYAQYANHGTFADLSGTERATGWDMARGGFRFDLEGEDDLQLTVQGDLYATGYSDAAVRVPVPGNLVFEADDLAERYAGGNALVRIGREPDEKHGWRVQSYYDHTKTRGGRPGFEVRRDTADVDYRHWTALGESEEHVLMWGLGYRYSRDKASGVPSLYFDPGARSLHTYSAFIQDTWAIIPKRLHLLAGTKLEHNDFTGFEIQPSGRLAWTPDDRQTVWGAISRAVRTPSRIAENVRFTTAYVDPGSGSVPLQIVGDPDLDSEQMLSFELGYRMRPTPTLTLDFASYYNDYDDLITLPVPAGTIGNRGDASIYGFELAGQWQVAPNWRLSGAYSFVRIDFHSVDGDEDDGKTPQQQFNLRSALDITDALEFNSAVYWVDQVPTEHADSYFRLDLGMTWRPHPGVEIAVWGQNILDDRHYEFGDALFQDAPLEVERSVYAQVSLRF